MKKNKIPMSSEALAFKRLKILQFIFVCILLCGGIIAGVMIAIQSTKYGDFTPVVSMSVSIFGIVLVFVGFAGFATCYYKIKKKLDN